VYNKNSPYSTRFYFLTSSNIDDLPEYYNSSFLDGFDYFLDKSGYIYFTKQVAGDNYLIIRNGAELDVKLLESNLDTETQNALFRINITDTSISPKLNTSWVSYQTDVADNLAVNVNRSSFNLKTNNILHFEYDNVDDTSNINVNALKLKNAYTDKFISKRGNCLITTSLNTPVPFFREYTNIYTGGDQEAGYRDMVLNYVFYNYDLKFNTGVRTEFTTPSSMYPFDQINVNDTNLIEDGAFGFDVPILSDRITTKNSLNQTDVYGSYLTTWLSGSTWVDRYYFPDIIARQNALSDQSLFAPTFSNVISQLAYQSRDKISKLQFFDVKSDLAFYPNETYYYDRVGIDDVSTYVDSISNLIQSGFTNVTNNSNITDLTPVSSIIFEASQYSSIPVESINNTGSFTVFFTINNSFDKQLNYVMGNLIEDGFGIYNDACITPVLYIRTGKVLNAYNTDTSLIYSLSFDDVISAVVDPAGLDNFHVVAGNGVYNVATDGTILAKVNVDNLSGYLDVNHNELTENIYFLKSDSTYIQYDTVSNLYTVGDITMFAPEETQPVGIYYHNGVIYGFESARLKKDSRNYLYGILGDSIVMRYFLDEPSTPPVLFARSNSVIRDINIDKDDNVWMLHNEYELTKVDKNRKLIGNLSFVDLLTCYNIDFVNEYKTDGTNYFYPVVLATDSNNNVYTIKDFSFDTSTNVTTLAENSIHGGDDQTLTGFNTFIGNKDFTNLNFEIKLVNIFNYLDKQSFKFSIPIESLSRFSNTFCFSYSNSGEIALYLNGTKIQSAQVDQYKYIGNIFVRDNIVVGSVPFHNNTILGDFLGIPSYGKLSNSSISNFRIYNRGLSDTEIKSLYLLANNNIEDLNTSLPCGQRNNIEEIQSVFKLSQPIAKSNVIDVVVKDTGISDTVLQDEISISIVSEVASTLPGDVTVRDVKFINY
jgi:hypothetical protein